METVEETSKGVKLFIKVIPSASRNEFSGLVGDRLKVRVKSLPERGKANKAVCDMLADALGLKKNAVSILSGNSNSRKTVALMGISVESVRCTLGL
jgi:uncharacterized protein (TIGR00251 family)